MLKTDQLKQLIIKLLSSELSGPDLNLYIRYCASLSAAYLFSRRQAGKLSPEYRHANESQIRQLALDSIAELFARDSKNAFFKLKQYYEPLVTKIMADADEALFMTRRLIVAHTKQTLAKTYSQQDPTGARIYRNLTLVPKRDTRVHHVRYGDSEYFYFWDQQKACFFPTDLNPTKPEISFDLAQHLLSTHIELHDSIPAMVEKFLRQLHQEIDCRHFITKRALFKLIKQSRDIEITPLESYHTSIISDQEDPLAVSEYDQMRYLRDIKKFIQLEIETRFVEKLKITLSQGEVYGKILDQYFEDLLIDGYAGKLPDYQVNSEFRGMPLAVWKNHRGRLEYLIKLSRAELKVRYFIEFPNEVSMSIEDK